MTSTNDLERVVIILFYNFYFKVLKILIKTVVGNIRNGLIKEIIELTPVQNSEKNLPEWLKIIQSGESPDGPSPPNAQSEGPQVLQG